MDSAGLVALAERVEAATGADREIDAAVAVALRQAPYTAPWASTFPDWRVATAQGYTRAEVWDGKRLVGHWHSFAPVTASLDAAMTLVPEGWTLRQAAFSAPCADDRSWHLNLHGGREGEDTFVGRGKTMALALCVAALRARARDEA